MFRARFQQLSPQASPRGTLRRRRPVKAPPTAVLEPRGAALGPAPHLLIVPFGGIAPTRPGPSYGPSHLESGFGLRTGKPVFLRLRAAVGGDQAGGRGYGENAKRSTSGAGRWAPAWTDPAASYTLVPGQMAKVRRKRGPAGPCSLVIDVCRAPPQLRQAGPRPDARLFEDVVRGGTEVGLPLGGKKCGWSLWRCRLPAGWSDRPRFDLVVAQKLGPRIPFEAGPPAPAPGGPHAPPSLLRCGPETSLIEMFLFARRERHGRAGVVGNTGEDPYC